MAIPSQYRVIRSIGVGATSEVFEAVKAEREGSIALKVFAPMILSDPESKQRLQVEIESLNRLRHANIVSLLGTHEEGDFFALELELIKGLDLRKWNQSFDIALVEPKLWILVQVARAIGAAHEAGVLHRDLKPENILVHENGSVKLTDFGLSRMISRMTLTRMGLLVGSLGYMAPECVNGLRADERSDVFSFGVVAYELLAGRPPFEADTPQALIKRLTEGIFTPLREINPALSPEIAALIESCLTSKFENRPQSIWNIEAALMTMLHRSRLAPLCRELTSTTQRASVLAEALKLKHGFLRETIQEQLSRMNSEPELKNRAALLAHANELQLLFPDDTLAIECMRSIALNGRKRQNRRGAWLTAGGFTIGLIFIGVAWLVFSNLWDSRRVVHPAIRNTASTSPTSTGNLSRLASAPPSSVDTNSSQRSLGAQSLGTKLLESKSAKARREFGTLIFDADSDVEITVDGARVDPKDWQGFKTKAGKRTIQLAKNGFKTIENIVEVRPGAKAVIRARQQL